MSIALRIAAGIILCLFLSESSLAQNLNGFEFVQADKLYYEKSNGAKKLVACKKNVEFIRGEIYLYCDSVSIKESKLECFGEVKIIKSGAFTITSDFVEIEQGKRITVKGNLEVSKPKKDIHRKRYKLK